MSVEVPPGFGGPVLRRVLGRRNGSGPAAMPVLTLVDPPPAINLRQRDPKAAVGPWRQLPKPAPPADAPIAERVAAQHWYHTIDLGNGLVTKGEFDHRELVPHYGLPEDLHGKEALDIASFDGFWAFELERRGAKVTSIDVDRIGAYDYPGPAREQFDRERLDRPHVPGFELAKEALGSKVTRIKFNSIYDLNPEEHGTYDFVHVADVLVHLESPSRALRAVRSVTRKQALIVDAYDPELKDPTGRYQLIDYRGGFSIVIWSVPSIDTLAQMVLDAGFSKVHVKSAYKLGWRTGEPGLYRAALIADV